jgi:hypothetical protein
VYHPEYGAALDDHELMDPMPQQASKQTFNRVVVDQDKLERKYGPSPWQRSPTNFARARLSWAEVNYFRLGPNKHYAGCLFRLQGNLWFLNTPQIHYCVRQGILGQLPDVTDKDMDDLDRSDWIVKTLAICQSVWLAAQLLTRKLADVPSSQLEVVALSYAVCAMALYVANWSKLKDVRRYVAVPAARWPEAWEMAQLAARASDIPYESCPEPWAKTYAVYDWPASLNTYETDDAARGWVPELPAEANKCYPMSGGDHEYPTDEGWAWLREKYTDAAVNAQRGKSLQRLVLVITVLVTVPYGAIHFWALVSPFPTEIEWTLWLVASSITTGLPLAFLVGAPFLDWLVVAMRWPDKVHGFLFDTALFGLGLVYVVSRVFLLAEAVRALFYLPPEVFQATWVGNMPHVA